jgi:hypothetical protein
VAPAAAHSRRETTCRIAVKFIKKIFLTLVNQADCEWSIRCFFTQKDRNRHWQSDKFRQTISHKQARKAQIESAKTVMCLKCLFVASL